METIEQAEKVKINWIPKVYDALYALQLREGEDLINKIKVLPDDYILDIGSGTGKLTTKLAQAASNGSVVGIDSSKEMVRFSLKNKSEEIKNIQFIHKDIFDTNHENEFTLVFSNYTLHLLGSPLKILNIIYESLVPRGKIGVHVPAKGSFDLDIQTATQVLEKLDLNNCFKNFLCPGHYPTGKEYKDYLVSAGFKKIKIEEIDYDYYHRDAEQAIAFHLNGGFTPILSEIPERIKGNFIHHLKREFEKKETEKGILTKIKSLHVFASKGGEDGRVIG